MRLTYSGEFLHAAPWSVASQGHANVSARLHGHEHRERRLALRPLPDRRRRRVHRLVVHMTLDNGYGDWNEPFGQYARGSALH